MNREIKQIASIVSTLIGPAMLWITLKTRYWRLLRRKLVNRTERLIHRVTHAANRPEKINQDRYIAGRSLLHSAERALQSRNISDHALRSVATVINGAINSTSIRDQFKEKSGHYSGTRTQNKLN